MFLPIVLFMRGRKLSLLAAIVALGLVAPIPALALDDTSSHDVGAEEARFVELINAERVKAGLGPLTPVVELVTVGREWSAVMLAQSGSSDPCQISHNPTLATKVTANWRRLGENVGCGNVDVDFLHEKFVASPPHFRNIMDPTFDSIGIGIAYRGDVMFVTEQFMDLRDPAATPTVLALTPRASAKSIKLTKKKR